MESKVIDIVYSEDVIGGQEHLPFSQRKYKHPQTKEPMSYSGYMTYVEKGEAIEPEVLFATRIKYILETYDEDGIITQYKYDKTISTKGPIEVENVYPNEGDFTKYYPENIKPLEGQETLTLSQRKYPEPYSGEPISYSAYMKHVKDDETLPTPQELYNSLLTRNPKELNRRQKHLPPSSRMYKHPLEPYYIGYSSYMNLVKEGKAKHPDKI